MAKPSFNRIVTRAPSSYEDVLTEVLAFVLRLDIEAARAMLKDMVGCDLISQPKVTTQEPTRAGDRVDLAVDVPQRCLIWIEAKLDSGEGDSQLQRYACALEQLRYQGEKHLVYLTRPGESEGPIRKVRSDFNGSGVEFHAYDWQQLAESLQAKADEGGQVSLIPEYFVEFLRERGAFVESLQESHLGVLEGFQQTKATTQGLVRRTNEKVAAWLSARQEIWDAEVSAPLDGDRKRWEQSFPRCWANYSPPKEMNWSEGVRLEWNLDVSEAANRGSDRLIAAGVTFLDQQVFDEVVMRISELCAESDRGDEKHVFQEHDEEGLRRYFCFLPLGRLEQHKSIDGQAVFAAQWITDAFEIIIDALNGSATASYLPS